MKSPMHQSSWTLLHCVGSRYGFTANKYKWLPVGPPARSGYCWLVGALSFVFHTYSIALSKVLAPPSALTLLRPPLFCKPS